MNPNSNPFSALGLPSGSTIAELLYIPSGALVVHLRDQWSNHSLWWRQVTQSVAYVPLMALGADQSLTSPKVSADGRGIYCILNVGNAARGRGWYFGGVLYLEPATGLARNIIEPESDSTWYVADILTAEPHDASLICVVGRQLPEELVMTYRVERFVLSDRRFQVICKLETPFA